METYTQLFSLSEASKTQKPVFRLGWQYGYAYAGFSPEISQAHQQQAAQHDAEQLCLTIGDKLLFLDAWAQGVKAFELGEIHPSLPGHCACGHLLRSAVERLRGWCLECGIQPSYSQRIENKMSTHVSTMLPASSSSSEADTTALISLFVKVLQSDTLNSLTFTDPWGTGVAQEAKKKETRSWPAPRKYWGSPLAIHISGTLTPEARNICNEPLFSKLLEKAGYARDLRQRFPWNLPLKQIIAIAWLENVDYIDPDYSVDPQERFFGNYHPGRYAWNFGAVYRLKQPLVAIGHLGVWQWAPPESFWTEVQGELDGLREGLVESYA